jgi:hypothetical protein
VREIYDTNYLTAVLKTIINPIHRNFVFIIKYFPLYVKGIVALRDAE